MTAASAKLAPKKREKFLLTLAETGNVSRACVEANLDRGLAYQVRKDNAEFREQWERALDVACDALEAEARRRAVEGVTEPVFYKGEVCGQVQKYSDTLLMFLLNGNNPAKFKRRTELSSDPDSPPVVLVKPSNGRE